MSSECFGRPVEVQRAVNEYNFRKMWAVIQIELQHPSAGREEKVRLMMVWYDANPFRVTYPNLRVLA